MVSERKGTRGRTLYQALDFVTLRAPLLPIEAYLALGDGTSSVVAVRQKEPGSQTADGAPAATANAATLAPTDATIRRALAIGSPSLLQALDETPATHKKAAQLAAKLRRFLVRMSTRPTPFGAFAGVALADWGRRTDVSLAGPARTQSRIDMEWLMSYAMMLEAQPAIRNQIRWVTNSAAWDHHGRVAIAERELSRNGSPPSSVSIASTPAVRRVLDLARTPTPYADLVDKLTEGRGSPTREKVERFLQQLWQQGFFRTELRPPLTVTDPAEWLCNKLRGISTATAARVQLDGLLRSVANCDAVEVGCVPDALRRVSAHAAVIGGPQIDMPVQVDAALQLAGRSIASTVADEAARVAELLLRLTPMPGGPPNTAGYRQAFLMRYGPDREVPLLEMLHPEWGLGPLGQHSAVDGAIDRTQAALRSQTLQHLALGAIRDAQLTIELNEDLLSRLQTNTLDPSRLAPSLDLNLFLLASSASDIDGGQFQLAVGPNLGASQAGRNLGRFAHLLGVSAQDALLQSARQDELQNPERICAEIVCLPRKLHSANVIVRPAVRRYEVVQGTNAGVGSDSVIPLDELVVGIRRERFCIRWAPRDVEVTFTASHMLNPMQVSTECRVLLELSRDGITPLTYFDWGPANGFLFLPRVQSRRSILRGAQWRLEPFASQKEASFDDQASFAGWLAKWRERWSVPRYVYLTAADNRLLYDLNDSSQVEDLRREFRSSADRGQCVLQEALPGPEHAWLRSLDGGRHIVELVVSLGLRPASVPHATAARLKPKRPHSPSTPGFDVRLCPPGSDWLYAKLYGPRSSQDDFISGPLRELCANLVRAGSINQWFFVRYADPETHLRVRFNGEPRKLVEAVLPDFCAWGSALVAKGLCQKFAFETYDRELERYGGPEATTAAETLFSADSCAVADLLAVAPGVDRIVLTVASVDDFLDALGMEAHERLAWLKQAVISRKEASEEYRQRRERLTVAVADPARMGDAIGKIFVERRTALASVKHRLAALEAAGALTQPLTKLYASYIHMHCNRLWNDPSVERRVLALLMRTRAALAHVGKDSCREGDGSNPASASAA
jgi:thiopeptide-type bacteriocin biosynthesis protein